MSIQNSAWKNLTGTCEECIIFIDLICMIKLQNWYCYAKMAAENIAMEEALKRGIQLLIIVPSVTIGRMLQPTLNISSANVAAYMMGTKKAYSNVIGGYVDVQDVALAHILVYEDLRTHGRYLCIGDMLHLSEYVQMMRELFPQYPITNK
jgi:cinnamoyl-CoA reductase